MTVKNGILSRNESHRTLQFIAQSVVWLGLMAAPASAVRLNPLGTYSTGIFDDGASEISAYDPVTQRLFITNGSSGRIDVLDINNPSAPSLLFDIDLTPYGSGANSVGFKNGILAAAVENEIAQDPGNVVFFNADGGFLNSFAVGAVPDMLTFTPDGTKVLVANEGEPNSDYSIDPEGSVSIIDLVNGVGGATVTTAGFSAFNSQIDDLRKSGVRIFGPGASVAQDLEPEYIAVSEDSTKAWVSLQENNALAILDLTTGQFEEIVSLGFKNHGLAGNGLDASDRDDAINIATYNKLFGMFQPDAIAAYEADGKTYIVSANEGDARDYDTFAEEERVNDLDLDPTAFPNAGEIQENEVLGRLTVTTTLGDADGDGLYEELYVFGGRSFSIWDEDGNLVFDSGDSFENIIAERIPEFFNADNAENNFDNRSDNKGPEPEGLTIAKLFDRVYAFVGLERIGGVMIYDITEPSNPFFVNYFNSRDFSVAFDEDVFAGVNDDGDPIPTLEQLLAVGDLGPEGLLFISAEDSPNKLPLLVVTNEVSGTTTLYSVDVPEPASILGLVAFGSLGGLFLKRKRTAGHKAV